jgi:hypothetical protein
MLRRIWVRLIAWLTRLPDDYIDPTHPDRASGGGW